MGAGLTVAFGQRVVTVVLRSAEQSEREETTTRNTELLSASDRQRAEGAWKCAQCAVKLPFWLLWGGGVSALN